MDKYTHRCRLAHQQATDVDSVLRCCTGSRTGSAGRGLRVTYEEESIMPFYFQ